MSAANEFRSVSPAEPCRVCGKPDWCRRSRDGAHECHRVDSPSANGLKRIATTPAGFAVYREEIGRATTAPPARVRQPPRRYSSLEDAAEAFAKGHRGIVECIYQWTVDWHRARIRTAQGKAFCEITRSGAAWCLRGPSKPHVLYRESDVPSNGVIFVCEGEKACNAGWSIGLPCVTSGAANSAGAADWRILAGRDVVVLPDQDAPGARYAADVVARLHALAPPAKVRIVNLPGLREGEDLFEFVGEHRNASDADAVRAEILQLAEGTPLCADELWPEPGELPDELPAVAPFDGALLPDSLRTWITDIAERMQCPPDYPAIAAIITLATVIGRKVGIRPKRMDDWLVVPNLFGAAIGPPGLLKSPALEEPLALLKRLEIAAKVRFEAAQLEFAAEELIAEQRAALAKVAIKEDLRNEGGAAQSIARDLVKSVRPPPVRRRYIVNDSTVEKLGELLNQNPNGVLCYRDELIGLLKSLEKDGQEGARSFYLEAWNGTGRYTYDRIGRGTVDIEAAIVSILGSIQPGPLRAYLTAAAASGEGADGLMQRFQLAVYPDFDGEWRNVDRRPDMGARTVAFELVVHLDQASAAELGAQVDRNNPDAIPFVRFDDSAQILFDDWRSALEQFLRRGDEHPVLVEHVSKYRSLVPSLALILHLADGAAGSVGSVALSRAIAWARYLESHARRIYSVAIKRDAADAIALARKILAGKLSTEFSLRDVYRAGWIGLSDRDAVERAIQLLCDLDWLAETVEPTLGRSRKRFRVNPRIGKAPGKSHGAERSE